MKFILGLIVGVALGAGGMWFVLRKPAEKKTIAVAPKPDAGVKKATPKKGGHASPSTPSGEEAPITLSADDLKLQTEGDSLDRGARAVDMAGGEARDLSQDEVDAAFAPVNDAIVGCIKSARGEAPVTGRITAGVLVSPTGAVVKSRIEAPAYLLKHGLGGCARAKLTSLHFPTTNGEVTVTKWYDLGS